MPPGDPAVLEEFCLRTGPGARNDGDSYSKFRLCYDVTADLIRRHPFYLRNILSHYEGLLAEPAAPFTPNTLFVSQVIDTDTRIRGPPPSDSLGTLNSLLLRCIGYAYADAKLIESGIMARTVNLMMDYSISPHATAAGMISCRDVISTISRRDGAIMIVAREFIMHLNRITQAATRVDDGMLQTAALVLSVSAVHYDISEDTISLSPRFRSPGPSEGGAEDEHMNMSTPRAASLALFMRLCSIITNGISIPGKKQKQLPERTAVRLALIAALTNSTCLLGPARMSAKSQAEHILRQQISRHQARSAQPVPQATHNPFLTQIAGSFSPAFAAVTAWKGKGHGEVLDQARIRLSVEVSRLLPLMPSLCQTDSEESTSSHVACMLHLLVKRILMAQGQLSLQLSLLRRAVSFPVEYQLKQQLVEHTQPVLMLLSPDSPVFDDFDEERLGVAAETIALYCKQNGAKPLSVTLSGCMNSVLPDVHHRGDLVVPIPRPRVYGLLALALTAAKILANGSVSSSNGLIVGFSSPQGPQLPTDDHLLYAAFFADIALSILENRDRLRTQMGRDHPRALMATLQAAMGMFPVTIACSPDTPVRLLRVITHLLVSGPSIEQPVLVNAAFSHCSSLIDMAPVANFIPIADALAAALSPDHIEMDTVHSKQLLQQLILAGSRFALAFRSNLCSNVSDSNYQIQPSESISVVFSDTLGTPLPPQFLGTILGQRDPTSVTDALLRDPCEFLQRWGELRCRLEEAFLRLLILCDGRRAILSSIYEPLTTAVRLFSMVEFRFLDCCQGQNTVELQQLQQDYISWAQSNLSQQRAAMAALARGHPCLADVWPLYSQRSEADCQLPLIVGRMLTSYARVQHIQRKLIVGDSPVGSCSPSSGSSCGEKPIGPDYAVSLEAIASARLPLVSQVCRLHLVTNSGNDIQFDMGLDRFTTAFEKAPVFSATDTTSVVLRRQWAYWTSQGPPGLVHPLGVIIFLLGVTSSDAFFDPLRATFSRLWRKFSGIVQRELVKGTSVDISKLLDYSSRDSPEYSDWMSALMFLYAASLWDRNCDMDGPTAPAAVVPATIPLQTEEVEFPDQLCPIEETESESSTSSSYSDYTLSIQVPASPAGYTERECTASTPESDAEQQSHSVTPPTCGVRSSDIILRLLLPLIYASDQRLSLAIINCAAHLPAAPLSFFLTTCISFLMDKSSGLSDRRAVFFHPQVITLMAAVVSSTSASARVLKLVEPIVAVWLDALVPLPPTQEQLDAALAKGDRERILAATGAALASPAVAFLKDCNGFHPQISLPIASFWPDAIPRLSRVHLTLMANTVTVVSRAILRRSCTAGVSSYSFCAEAQDIVEQMRPSGVILAPQSVGEDQSPYGQGTGLGWRLFLFHLLLETALAAEDVVREKRPTGGMCTLESLVPVQPQANESLIERGTGLSAGTRAQLTNELYASELFGLAAATELLPPGTLSLELMLKLGRRLLSRTQESQAFSALVSAYMLHLPTTDIISARTLVVSAIPSDTTEESLVYSQCVLDGFINAYSVAPDLFVCSPAGCNSPRMSIRAVGPRMAEMERRQRYLQSLGLEPLPSPHLTLGRVAESPGRIATALAPYMVFGTSPIPVLRQRSIDFAHSFFSEAAQALSTQRRELSLCAVIADGMRALITPSSAIYEAAINDYYGVSCAFAQLPGLTPSLVEVLKGTARAGAPVETLLRMVQFIREPLRVYRLFMVAPNTPQSRIEKSALILGDGLRFTGSADDTRRLVENFFGFLSYCCDNQCSTEVPLALRQDIYNSIAGLCRVVGPEETSAMSVGDVGSVITHTVADLVEHSLDAYRTSWSRSHQELNIACATSRQLTQCDDWQTLQRDINVAFTILRGLCSTHSGVASAEAVLAERLGILADPIADKLVEKRGAPLAPISSRLETALLLLAHLYCTNSLALCRCVGFPALLLHATTSAAGECLAGLLGSLCAGSSPAQGELPESLSEAFLQRLRLTVSSPAGSEVWCGHRSPHPFTSPDSFSPWITRSLVASTDAWLAMPLQQQPLSLYQTTVTRYISTRSGELPMTRAEALFEFLSMIHQYELFPQASYCTLCEKLANAGLSMAISLQDESLRCAAFDVFAAASAAGCPLDSYRVQGLTVLLRVPRSQRGSDCALLKRVAVWVLSCAEQTYYSSIGDDAVLLGQSFCARLSDPQISLVPSAPQPPEALIRLFQILAVDITTSTPSPSSALAAALLGVLLGFFPGSRRSERKPHFTQSVIDNVVSLCSQEGISIRSFVTSLSLLRLPVRLNTMVTAAIDSIIAVILQQHGAIAGDQDQTDIDLRGAAACAVFNTCYTAGLAAQVDIQLARWLDDCFMPLADAIEENIARDHSLSAPTGRTIMCRGPKLPSSILQPSNMSLAFHVRSVVTFSINGECNQSNDTNRGAELVACVLANICTPARTVIEITRFMNTNAQARHERLLANDAFPSVIRLAAAVACEVSTGVRTSRMAVLLFNELCAVVRNIDKPQWFVAEVSSLLPRTVGQERVRLMNEIDCTVTHLHNILNQSIEDNHYQPVLEAPTLADEILAIVSIYC